MANVKTYLNKILSAIYGKEVRSSIHDAIDAINTQVETTTKAEGDRVSSERNRVNAENARVDAETNRASAESLRVKAETSRSIQEAGRNAQEIIRKNSEKTRITAETARTNAESTRVSQENSRKSEEAKRISAESTRVQTENERKTAEVSREEAEKRRNLREEQRKKTFELLIKQYGEYIRKGFRKIEYPDFNTAWKAPKDGFLLLLISNITQSNTRCSLAQKEYEEATDTKDIWIDYLGDKPEHTALIPIQAGKIYLLTLPKDSTCSTRFYSLN